MSEGDSLPAETGPTRPDKVDILLTVSECAVACAMPYAHLVAL